MQRIRIVTLTAVVGLLTACSTGFRAGPIGLVNGPTGDFGDTQSNGITVGAHGEAGLALLSVTGELALTRFSGKDVNGVDTDAVTLWEMAAGARYFTGPLFLGAQVGAISGSDVSDEGLFRPEVGLRLGKLDAVARFKLGGDASWWSLGASYSIW